MKFTSTIFFLVSIFLVQAANAQEKATLSATLEKNKILIGEPVRLIIEANIPDNSPIKFLYIDTIDHFEFTEKPSIDTTNTSEGTIIKGIYTITSFDSGHWVIPSFSITEELKTDTIPVDVVFSDFDPNQEYHDVKDIIAVNPEEKKEWWYYAIPGAVLLLLLIYLLTRKKKKKVIVKEEEAIDPYKEALMGLEQLRREKPEARQYYSKLTDIFRLYIFRKKGILSLQKTTDDLVVQLKGLDMNKEQFENLAQSLRLSDFVKFAKYVPSKDDDTKVFEVIKNAIEQIEKIS